MKVIEASVEQLSRFVAEKIAPAGSESGSGLYRWKPRDLTEPDCTIRLMEWLGGNKDFDDVLVDLKTGEIEVTLTEEALEKGGGYPHTSSFIVGKLPWGRAVLEATALALGWERHD